MERFEFTHSDISQPGMSYEQLKEITKEFNVFRDGAIYVIEEPFTINEASSATHYFRNHNDFLMDKAMWERLSKLIPHVRTEVIAVTGLPVKHLKSYVEYLVQL